MKKKHWIIGLIGIVMLTAVLVVTIIVLNPEQKVGRENVSGSEVGDQLLNTAETDEAGTVGIIESSTDGSSLTDTVENSDKADATDIIIEGSLDKTTSPATSESTQTEEDNSESTEAIELPFVPYE